MSVSPSVRVRIAEPTDAAALHALAAETFALACPPGTTKESSDAFVAANLSEEKFTAYLADPARVLLVASVDEVDAGYTMLVDEQPTDPDVIAALSLLPTIELSKFYLLAGFHGTGVSSALMDATVNSARERGAAGAWLGVNQFNPRANRFYEKHGFAQVGTKTFYLGDHPEEDFVRERAL